MREINASEITRTIKELCMKANYELGEDVIEAFKKGRDAEESEAGKNIFNILLENAEIARKNSMATCQDTGLGVIFAEIGQDVHISGGSFEEAVNEGVRQGYQEGFLRKSTCHPFSRKNVGDNTPAVIHTRIVPGDKIKLTVAPKGGGSENMSRVTMLTPSSGRDGVVDFVVNRVKESGANPCPPIIVGVGIGGTFERSAFLAKQALLRPLGTPNPDPEAADLETELLDKINDLGIGPQGFGGRITALGVHVDIKPCHIASLPLAVNIQCHASRHHEAVI
jgi:fumarate hydratase subunit alpha